MRCFKHWAIAQFVGAVLFAAHRLWQEPSVMLSPCSIQPLAPPTLPQQRTFNNTSSTVCRVAITNSKNYHYEILESIAGQLPLHYLNLNVSNCETIVFDFHIMAWTDNAVGWIKYFKQSLKGKEIGTDSLYGNHVIHRTIGGLFIHQKMKETEIIDPTEHASYDAQVEATCICRREEYFVQKFNHGDKWMMQEDSRTCIFHSRCDEVSRHPRAVWISPHHDHHFIPTMLPKVNGSVNSTLPKPLCVIGTTTRRKWSAVKAFLDHASKVGEMEKVRINILGYGKFPQELRDYKNVVTQTIIEDYQEFHEQVAQCGAILSLIFKTTDSQESWQRDYFDMEGSLLRLSGTFPLIIAYKIPFLIHEEMFELYKKDLPVNAPFASHNNTIESFVYGAEKLLSNL